MRVALPCRRTRWQGMTLIEVMVSILLITIVVVAALGARYSGVKQARRADAYNTAGRLGVLLLEGWRSTGIHSTYAPETRFSGQMTITGGASGPAAPTDLAFTTLNNTSYHIVQDNVNYYATLAYYEPADAPDVLHVTVAFRHQYGEGTIAETDNFVQLRTYD